MLDEFKRARSSIIWWDQLGKKKLDKKLGNRIARRRLDVEFVKRARQAAIEGRGGTIDEILDDLPQPQ